MPVAWAFAGMSCVSSAAALSGIVDIIRLASMSVASALFMGPYPTGEGYKGLLISMLRTGSGTHLHQQISVEVGCILPLYRTVQAHRF